jgi:hypothetical protein
MNVATAAPQGEEQLQDIELDCIDCHHPFTYKVKDQLFFLRQGYSAPKRCLLCRQANKAKRAQQLSRQGRHTGPRRR